MQSMCISKCCCVFVVIIITSQSSGNSSYVVKFIVALLYIRMRRTLGSVWRRRGTSFSLAFVTERMASLLPRSRRRRLDFTPAVHFPLEIGKSFRDGFFHVVVANSRVHSDFAF